MKKNRKNVFFFTKHIIYFDVDKSILGQDAKDELQQFSDCFSDIKFNFLIEGHCDERGTTEYNLALGLRRAQSVQKYLDSIGVTESRVRTKTYGEESPIERGTSEDSWQKNRRAVLKFLK